ncbi:MAG: DUF6175 family protein [Candidatus Poribacteria bacterium]
MGKYVFLIYALIGLFIIGCAGKAPILPISREATIIESTNPAEVMVEATGIGRNTDEALLDARRAAIAVVLLGGSDPMLQTQDEKSKFEFIQTDIYSVPNINQYISWESTEIKNRIKIDGGSKIKLTKTFKVNKRMLEEEMVRRQVIKPRLQITETIGLPMIMVVPEVPKGEDPVDTMNRDPRLKHAAQSIESYLTSRKYDVQVPEQKLVIDGLTEAQQGIKGLENDLSYQLALAIGSDVYITFTVDVQERRLGGNIVRKASVGVRAYETTTARLLGTETGYSQERPTADLPLIEEAISGAIDNVLTRLNAYWKDDLTRGVQYKVTFSIQGNFSEDDNEDIGFAINRIIKKNTKSYKENVIADKTFDYLVWVDPKLISNSRELYSVLRQDYSGKGQLRSINITRKLLLLRVTD